MRATVTAREEMVQNWKRVAPSPPTTSEPLPRALNLQHVLDLGNAVFFTFRGRAYGIPPLAWRKGEQILDAWLEAKSFGPLLKRSDLRGYYRAINRLQRLLWSACRPTGPFRRFLRLLRIHPNPFRLATEGEIGELAVFTLGRRMKQPEEAPRIEVANGGT